MPPTSSVGHTTRLRTAPVATREAPLFEPPAAAKPAVIRRADLPAAKTQHRSVPDVETTAKFLHPALRYNCLMPMTREGKMGLGNLDWFAHLDQRGHLNIRYSPRGLRSIADFLAKGHSTPEIDNQFGNLHAHIAKRGGKAQRD